MVLNTQGAFSYTELMAMELGEYITLIEQMGIINKLDGEAEKKAVDKAGKMTLEQQMEMAANDPAIPIKRL